MAVSVYRVHWLQSGSTSQHASVGTSARNALDSQHVSTFGAHVQSWYSDPHRALSLPINKMVLPTPRLVGLPSPYSLHAGSRQSRPQDQKSLPPTAVHQRLLRCLALLPAVPDIVGPATTQANWRCAVRPARPYRRYKSRSRSANDLSLQCTYSCITLPHVVCPLPC